MAKSNRGFASMDAEKQRTIASKGGKASGGQFKVGDPRASEAGKRGAAAQSVEAKRRGGERSQQNNEQND